MLQKVSFYLHHTNYFENITKTSEHTLTLDDGNENLYRKRTKEATKTKKIPKQYNDIYTSFAPNALTRYKFKTKL